MKFGETEYSLREFVEATLLKAEAYERHANALDGMKMKSRYLATAFHPPREDDRERAKRLELIDEIEADCVKDMHFWQWIMDQCDREGRKHIKRLREIYADTITKDTEACQDNDH